MSEVRARDRGYARRLGAAIAAALALHAAAWFLPSPRRDAPPLVIPDTFHGIGLIDVLMAAGEAAGAATATSEVTAENTDPPAPIPVPIEQPATEITEPTSHPIETAIASSPSPTGNANVAGAANVASGSGSDAGSDSLGGAEPGSQILQPRFTVHPHVPDAVRRRKIDDFVMLELLVGTNGRVENVRISHPIEHCEECNASAVEAAFKFEYEPPMHAGRSVRAWTTFRFAFTYRNRR